MSRNFEDYIYAEERRCIELLFSWELLRSASSVQPLKLGRSCFPKYVLHFANIKQLFLVNMSMLCALHRSSRNMCAWRGVFQSFAFLSKRCELQFRFPIKLEFYHLYRSSWKIIGVRSNTMTVIKSFWKIIRDGLIKWAYLGAWRTFLVALLRWESCEWRESFWKFFSIHRLNWDLLSGIENQVYSTLIHLSPDPLEHK